MRPSDTSPEAWKVYLDAQRKLTPSERMQQVFEWSEIIRQFHLAGIRQRHPNADEREIFLRATKINLGDDLFRKVYGDVLNDGNARRVT